MNLTKGMKVAILVALVAFLLSRQLMIGLVLGATAAGGDLLL